jgi:hypothetical protein
MKTAEMRTLYAMGTCHPFRSESQPKTGWAADE